VGRRSRFWGFRRWVAVGGGPDLGFGGCGGVGIRLRLTVDGYRLLPQFGYGCREREEREMVFFLSYLKKL
jgi:hypothetical protein